MIAVLYFKLPDIREPVATGTALVVKDDADLENATHLARQALERAAAETAPETFVSGQDAVMAALKARGYEVSTYKRMVVDRE